MMRVDLEKSNSTESTKEARRSTKKILCGTLWFSGKLCVITNTRSVLLLLLFISFIGAKAQTLPSAAEYQALMDLYASTNGPSWTNKTGWSTADPSVVQSVQGWYGIGTDQQGHISINLSNNNLIGAIPSSIGNLTNLTYLNLTVNQLTGSIPDEIGNLINLTYLNLRYNKLSGSIPTQIGQLVNLRKLEMDNNNLSGSIPPSIGNLTLLQELYLYENSLTGSIPPEIGNLTNIQNITLSTNQLSGSIPSSIGNLTNLSYLSLTGNQLTGSVPSEIGNLINLTYLNLRYNKLSGSIPTQFGQLVNLGYILMDNNNLSGSIPPSIGNLTLLQELYLYSNSLTGSIPAEIGNLVNAKIIQLNTNQLTGNIPASIGNLTQLQHFQLHANLLSGILPASMANMSSLVTLTLNHNTNLAGDILVGQIASLSNIDIRVNKFTFSNLLLLRQNKPQASINPQNAVDEEKAVQGILNSSLTLTTSVDRNTTPLCVYRWYRKKPSEATPVPLNDASTSGHTVTVPLITQADAGTKYYYTITNPSVPDLALSSNWQTLQVVTCSTPILDFQFQEANGTHIFTPALTQAQGCTVTYTWDFGDGNTSQEQAATHEYLNTGSYTVKLTASYQCGSCSASTVTKEYQVEITNSGICESVYCDGNGGVGIGTRKTSGFRLSVNGKIRASDIVKVYPQTQWPDFVFAKEYKMRPLSEVETFIKANGHLPEMPSAKEVEKEGVELGDMNAKLLQKIEELTLFIIDQEKRIANQENRISKQEEKMTEQTKVIEELKSKIQK